MTDLLKQSTALKTQYLRESSQAVTLVGEIQSDAGWAFANNSQNLGRLQAAQEKLQSELNTFDHGFLVTDANDIKKHVAPELLNLQLESFLAPLGGVSRISHGHTGEHDMRFDVTQDKCFEKLGRRYVDEILMTFFITSISHENYRYFRTDENFTMMKLDGF